MGALASLLEKQHNTYFGGLWSQKRLWYGKRQVPSTVLASNAQAVGAACLPLSKFRAYFFLRTLSCRVHLPWNLQSTLVLPRPDPCPGQECVDMFPCEP